MIRHLTTVGCSLAMAWGTAGFLGCEEQGLDQGTYGTETEVNEGLDTQAPAIDGTGVGLDTEPMHGPAVGGAEPMGDPNTAAPSPAEAPNAPADRPGMPSPQDLQNEPTTPTVPNPQGGGGMETTPGQSQPAMPGTPGGDTGAGTGGGM